MLKLLPSFLSANRKRRSLIVRIALNLLRPVRDVEECEVSRFSDEIDKFDRSPDAASRRACAAAEDERLDSEHALGYLQPAIDVLEFAYEARF